MAGWPNPLWVCHFTVREANRVYLKGRAVHKASWFDFERSHVIPPFHTQSTGIKVWMLVKLPR